MNRPSPALRKALERALASLLVLSTTLSYAAPLADYAGAGKIQGAKDSADDGQSRGKQEGHRLGKQDGYAQGYNECAAEMRQNAIRRGERQGDIDGSVKGRDDGIAKGTDDGISRGQQEGSADGATRADRQADADATPVGTADGIAEANQSDAAARGAADGKVAGNVEAKEDAEAREYQPARVQYRNERIAEPIRSESTIVVSAPVKAAGNQLAATVEKSSSLGSKLMAFFSSSSSRLAAVSAAPSPSPRPRDGRGGNGDGRGGNGDGRGNGGGRDGRGNGGGGNGGGGNGSTNPNDPTVPDVKPTMAAEKAIAFCKANAPSTVALSSSSATRVEQSQLALAPNPEPSPSDRPRGGGGGGNGGGGNGGGGNGGGGNGGGGGGPRPTPTPSPTPTSDPSPAPSTTPPPVKSEFEKCIDEYRPAYEQAFVDSFRTEYVQAWRKAYNNQYDQWRPEGCRAAQAADYSQDYNRGYRRAYDDAYQAVYRSSYNETFPRVYRDEFAKASDASYRQTYEPAYDRHYQAAKAEAIRVRTGQLYQAAYDSAKSAEYSARYPGYKAEVVKRARADEAAEFTRVPVRLLSLKLQESVKDQILEPGEKLTVDMDLRNFSDAPVAARELDLRAVAKTSSGLAIPGAVTLLPKDLAAKSLSHVVGAFDIRLDESAVGKIVSVELQLSVRGNRLATEKIDLEAKTLTTIALLETPVMRLGYPGQIRLRVTNQSSLVLPESATLAISANMEGVTLQKTTESIVGLRAGESRDVVFPFMVDSASSAQTVNFAASLNLASGRRVGLLNETRQVPSMQDYAFKIRNGVFDGDIVDLRKKGTVRVPIFVKNVSQRAATESITVTASIKGENAKHFKFTKGNQATYSPLGPGKEEKQKIVVKVDSKNSGGIFSIEVREGGRLIGRYEEQF
jgi:hypothetical protein